MDFSIGMVSFRISGFNIKVLYIIYPLKTAYSANLCFDKLVFFNIEGCLTLEQSGVACSNSNR